MRHPQISLDTSVRNTLSAVCLVGVADNNPS